VRLAFHCARRLRVFARDILRLGTAMIEHLLYRGIEVRAANIRRRQLHFRIAGELHSIQNRI
jgi:hypothetical protein